MHGMDKQLVALISQAIASQPKEGATLPPPRLLVSNDEAATMLGTSKRSLYRLREQPGFPEPVELGMNSQLWRVADLVEWVVKLPTNAEKKALDKVEAMSVGRAKAAAERAAERAAKTAELGGSTGGQMLTSAETRANSGRLVEGSSTQQAAETASA